METVAASGIHPSHSVRHADGRYLEGSTSEALHAADVTVPLTWGTSLTVRRRQLVARTRGGSL